jgi:hypothetical protein
MILNWYYIDHGITLGVLSKLQKQITEAFDIDNYGVFEVNPKKFFKKIKGELNPAVINSAKYISKGFQLRLKSRGWSIDHTLDDQEIDGYIELQENQEGAVLLTKDNFLDTISILDLDSPEYLGSFLDIYSKYYIRNIFKKPENIPSTLFSIAPKSVKIKVGLEFETGNIASSFRAISKLNHLYHSKLIDIGIFITCKDKSVSTNIWPSANRNGSIEELENRKFMKSIMFPSLIIGFSPDSWNYAAAFLGDNQKRFVLGNDNEIVVIKGKKYLHYLAEDCYSEIVEVHGRLDLQ